MTTTQHDDPPGLPDQDDRGMSAVAVGNREQDAAWNGEEGELWAAHPGFFDASVRHLHRRLMMAAAIGPDDRVLDLGCGTGQCTHDAARQATRGSALGIDLSRPMLRVAVAVARREGLDNAGFVQGDAQVHAFASAAFDVAIGRTSTMFFSDQVAAFRNVARALRTSGRLALVSWRGPHENEWFSSLVEALRGDAPPAPAPPPDAPSPFRHADPLDVADILTAAGFEQVDLAPLETPMYFGRDVDEGFPVLAEMLGWMVRDLDPAARQDAMSRLRSLLRDHESAEGIAFGCAAWLITARRT